MSQRELFLKRVFRIVIVCAVLVGLAWGSTAVYRSLQPGSGSSAGANTGNIGTDSTNPLYRAMCRGEGHVETAGKLSDKSLRETSGIVASRRSDDQYWVHNDSGDDSRIYAVNGSGSLLASVTLAGATAEDWEDIAAGPGPTANVPYLYIGDTGDNMLSRDQVTVYRLPEPDVASTTTDSESTATAYDTLHFRYPDGTGHNVEAIMVDPISGKLYFIDKQDSRVSNIYEAPAGLNDGSSTTLTRVGTVRFKLPGGGYQKITAADISPGGTTIAIRTYERLYVYDRTPGSSVAAALATAACAAPHAVEPQGEAAAFTRSGSGLITVSEGSDQRLHAYTTTP